MHRQSCAHRTLKVESLSVRRLTQPCGVEIVTRMNNDPAGGKGRHPWCGIALGLITTLAITAFAAASSVKRFDSTVTLSGSDPFHGRVTSDKHGCEVQRKVKVFNVRPGPDGLFGTDTTNNHGRWSLPATPTG